MKKNLLITLVLVIMILASCTKTQSISSEPQSHQKITLSEIGPAGTIHNQQSAWEILNMKDYDVWILFIKKARLVAHLSSGDSYTVELSGKDYYLKPNPLNPSILKLLLPSKLKPNNPASLVIKATDPRDNGLIKNDISLVIEDIYITKEEKNGTRLNEISIEDYTNLYSAGTDNFAYDLEGKFIRPSHVKSNEENAYEVNTYFDARTVATTESATGAFQFLKDVDNYESYIIMENPNRFRITGESTELREPDDRWRIRQLGTMGELDSNNVFNIVDDTENDQFILSIDKEQLPSATYTGTYFWETELKEATACDFDKTEEQNIFQTVIAYTDAPSTEIILNSRFQAVEYNVPDVELLIPADGANIGETSLTLTWEATPGSRKDAQSIGLREVNTLAITHYNVYFATETSNFPTHVQTSEKSLQLEGLEYGTIYKWKVQAVQNDTQMTLAPEATFSISSLSTNTDIQLTGADPQLVQFQTTPSATILKVASETSVATVLANLKSADDSVQNRYVYNDTEPLEDNIPLTEGATLVVISEDGDAYKTEYKIIINDTAFVRLYTIPETSPMGERTSRGDSDYVETWHNTIADAVASANTTELSTITVWPGRYAETLDLGEKPIHLTSTDPDDEMTQKTTIIDGNENPTVIFIGSLPDSPARGTRTTGTFIIEGFTITNAKGESSGSNERIPTIPYAVVICNRNTIIRNNIITENGSVDAEAGGIAVSAIDVEVKICDNTISHNVCGMSNFGGGISITGNPEIIDNTIANNTAEYGGGIYVLEGQPTIANNTITNNIAERGAGIYVDDTMEPVNAEGEPWRKFNAPYSEVSFVEHSDNRNTYSGNSIPEQPINTRDGEQEGTDIYFEGEVQTTIGTLAVTEELLTDGSEGKSLISATYTFDGFSNEGSLTIDVPIGISVDEHASVTIDGGQKQALSSEQITGQKITLSGITGENCSIRIDLLVDNTLETGDYVFTSQADADGLGSRYTASAQDTATLTVKNMYQSPQIELLLPADNAQTENTSITLTWEATPGGLNQSPNRNGIEITEYKVYFATSTDEYPEPAVTTEKQMPKNDLVNGTTYKWKVAAIQSDGQIATSTEWSFSVISGVVFRYNQAGEFQDSYDDLITAVGSATDNDIIKVKSGVTLNHEEIGEINIDGKTLTIQSTAQEPFIIDCANSTRAFYITNSSSITIINAIITNGNSGNYDGGGIRLLSSSTLHLNRTTIKRCTTSNRGGGIFISSSTLTTVNCTITENNTSGSLEGGGGVLINADSIFHATDTLIASNTSSTGGGGLYLSLYVIATLTNCTITNNEAVSGAGIFCNKTNTCNIIDSVISGNTAKYDGQDSDTGRGGGIYLDREVNLNIHDSMITNNEAEKEGGGFFVQWDAWYGRVIIYSNQISNNCSSVAGGGIYIKNSGSNKPYIVKNADGDYWLLFDCPASQTTDVEHNNDSDNNNEYSGNTINGNEGANGANIDFYYNE